MSLNVKDQADPDIRGGHLTIANHASAHIKRPYLDHAEFLHDEDGVPK